MVLLNRSSSSLKTLKIKLIGEDNWNRPVYKDKKGNLYKDVNLGVGILELCTVNNNDFYGEPDAPINYDKVKIKIVTDFNKDKRAR